MNNSQVMDLQAVLRLSCSMIRDFGRLCNVDVTRDIEEISTRVSNEGSFFVTRALLGFGRDLLRSIDQGRCSSGSFRGFKRIRGGGYPYFLKGFLERIFDSSGVVLPREIVDVQCFKAVYQICLSWYKYEVDCPESVVHEQYRNFVLLDSALEDVAVPKILDAGLDDPIRVVIDRTYSVLRRVLSDLIVNDDNFFPCHGSGSTSEGFNRPYQKWEYTFDRLAEDPDIFPHNSPLLQRLWQKKCRGVGRDDEDEFTPVATLTDVHKDSRGRRLISKEAAKKMMIQQAMFKIFVDYLETSELTAGQVNFTDQTVNQSLALESSMLDGYWATIDFKDASDRVIWDIVKIVFPNRIVEYLQRARTEYYTIPREELTATSPTNLVGVLKSVNVPEYYTKLRGVRVKKSTAFFFAEKDGNTSRLVRKFAKHAPMGSAMCFPVMALFIWAVAVQRVVREAVNVTQKSSGHFTENELRAAASRVFVYGDDLIIPSEIAPLVVADLELLGMLCNKDKSFVNAVGGNVFRESCGTDAFNGAVVTPVKFKSVIPTSLDDIGSIESWVEYTNQLADRGLLQTAVDAYSIVRQAVGDRFIGLLHNSTNPGSICFSPLVTKLTGWYKVLEPAPVWDERFQIFKRPMLTSTPCQSFIPLSPKSESVSLFRWLAEHAQPEPIHDTYRPISNETVFVYRSGLSYTDERKHVRDSHLRNALPDDGGRKFVFKNGNKIGWMEDDPKKTKTKIVLGEYPPIVEHV